MKMAPVTEVKAQFNAYLDRIQEEPVVITKHGRPIAVLVPASDEDDLESLILAYTPRFRQLLEAADERINQTGGLKEDEFWELVDASAEASRETHDNVTSTTP